MCQYGYFFGDDDKRRHYTIQIPDVGGTLIKRIVCCCWFLFSLISNLMPVTHTLGCTLNLSSFSTRVKKQAEYSNLCPLESKKFAIF